MALEDWRRLLFQRVGGVLQVFLITRFRAKMVEFPLPVPKIWRTRKRVAIQILVRLKSDPLAAFTLRAQRGTLAALVTYRVTAAIGSDLNRTIRIQLMNIHVSECKYHCLHLVPKFGDVHDRQNLWLRPTADSPYKLDFFICYKCFNIFPIILWTAALCCVNVAGALWRKTGHDI